MCLNINNFINLTYISRSNKLHFTSEMLQITSDLNKLCSSFSTKFSLKTIPNCGLTKKVNPKWVKYYNQIQRLAVISIV